MANFCQNCGKKLKPGVKFCSSCGTKLEAEPSPKPIPSTREGVFGLNIRKEDLVGQWEGRESDVSETTMYKRKGFLLLTKDEFIFVGKVGVFSKKWKECWRTSLLAIKSVKKMPFPVSAVFIAYSKAPEGAGALRRFIGTRNLAFKIKDSKSFIKKIKELNPKIK